jgi:hypothetical protein
LANTELVRLGARLIIQRAVVAARSVGVTVVLLERAELAVLPSGSHHS